MSSITSSVSNLVVSAGEGVALYSAANVNGATVSGSGAQITVADGASYLSNVTVDSGGTLHAWQASGPYAYNVSGVTINDGALLDVGHVYLNADGNSATVTNFGGSVDNVTVNSGGQVRQGTVTVINDITVNSSASLFMDYGETKNLTLNSGGTVTVNRGDVRTGIVDGGIIYAGQLDSNADKAATSNVTLSDGGRLIASGNGRTFNTILVGAGTAEVISAGAQANGTQVTSNATQTVSSNGLASGSVVLSTGQINVSGGTTSAATISSGGTINLYSGGTDRGTTLTGTGATEAIYAGASATSAVVTSGAVQTVYASGIASATVVSASAKLVVSGGTTISALLTGKNEYAETVYAGGVASNTSANSGAWLSISAQGSTVGTVLKDGGTAEVLYSGATATGTLVTANAGQTVYTGASAFNTVASAGGHMFINGGTTVNATVTGADAYEHVYNSGLISGTTITSQGQVTVDGNAQMLGGTVGTSGSLLVQQGSASGILISGAGASATTQTATSLVSGATVVSGGALSVSAGVASATTLSNGGTETVFNTGSAVDTTLYSGGVLNLSSGGVVSGATIPQEVAFSGGGLVNLYSGVTNGLSVSNGGSLNISSGAVGSSNLVASGGTVNVYSSGIGSNTSAVSGGLVFVSNGGTTVSAVLTNSSTAETIYAGGVASHTSASGIAQLYVSAQGSTVSTVLTEVGTAEVVYSGGTTTGTRVTSGAGQTISSGGVASGTVASDNGHVFVFGGTTVDATVTGSGSYITMTGSSFASGVTTIQSASQLVATGSSHIDNLTVNNPVKATYNSNEGVSILENATVNSGTVSGGIFGVSQKAVVSAVTVTGSGTVAVWGSGAIDSALVTSGGTLAVGTPVDSSWTDQSNGGVLSNATVLNGGSLIIQSGGVLAGSATLALGASATLNASAGGVVYLNGDDNTGLTLTGLSSGGAVSTVISAFNGNKGGDSDGIDIQGVSKTDVTSVDYVDANGKLSENYVTLTLANGGKITLNIPGISKLGYTLDETGQGNDILFEVCFLAGSMIRTRSGDVVVESLQMGDSVMTWDWKAQAAVERQIIWTGRKHMTVKTDRAEDEAGYPVRILKDAIAENVPSQDLLVTPEHCLFFDNRFVPVRMLVNGRSIFYDRAITAYDYFHIETEEHSVIWANDTLTESYLDTGNRSTFAQDGSVVRLMPKAPEKTWDADGAAELCVERGFVEPLFTTLAGRAVAQELVSQAEILEVTQYSDIHLVTTLGQIIRPARQMKDSVVFMLPTDVAAVRIVTRTSRPSETIGPFVDDRRHLGVLVGQVTLFDGKNNHAVTTHLDREVLLGWDVKESLPCRWTNGDAILPLPSVRSRGLQMLTLQIIAAGPYVIKKTNKTARSLKTAG